MPRKHCKIDWDRVPLGRRTDRAIADDLGVGVWVVRRQRKIRRIEPFYNGTGIDWTSVGLGLDPDFAVAQRLGVPEPTVRSARIRLGIRAHLYGGGRLQPTAATPRTTVPPRGFREAETLDELRDWERRRKERTRQYIDELAAVTDAARVRTR